MVDGIHLIPLLVRMKNHTKFNYENYEAFGHKLIADVLRYSSEDLSALNGSNDRAGPYRLLRKGPVRVLERTVSGTGVNLIRAETMANARATQILSWMCEPGFLQDIDTNFLQPKVNLKSFDANHEITYYTYGSSGPVAKRDFVTFEVNAKHAEGTSSDCPLPLTFATRNIRHSSVHCRLSRKTGRVYSPSPYSSQLICSPKANQRSCACCNLGNSFSLYQNLYSPKSPHL